MTQYTIKQLDGSTFLLPLPEVEKPDKLMYAQFLDRGGYEKHCNEYNEWLSKKIIILPADLPVFEAMGEITEGDFEVQLQLKICVNNEYSE